MALVLIIQLVVLFCFIKGSLDKMFGRRAEYRNRRTKRFARIAAAAAAGGSSKNSIPLSHHRPLYRPDTKPQLPPRPSRDHPLMRSSGSPASQAAFQTTATGDIVLPSWTEAGPTPLRVIVEDPEGELSRSNSPIPSRPHSPAVYRDSQRSPVYGTSLNSLGPCGPPRLETAHRSGCGNAPTRQCSPSRSTALPRPTLVSRRSSGPSVELSSPTIPLLHLPPTCTTRTPSLHDPLFPPDLRPFQSTLLIPNSHHTYANIQSMHSP